MKKEIINFGKKMNQQEIWIFGEHDNQGTKKITLELLTEGRKLASQLKGQLCACLIGYHVEDHILTLSKYGARKVYLVEKELLSEYDLDAYAFVLGELIREYSPYMLIVGATPSGTELAPRVAARFKLPCITEVKKITGDKEDLQITKSAYNDHLYVMICPLSKRPLIVTFSPGETDIKEENEPKQVEVIRKNIEIKADLIRTKRKRFIKGNPRTIKIEEADLIVGVGKGVGIEGLPIIEEMADVLGASIGGSRAAVDAGIIPFGRQIGITGKSVAPRLLIACGISGAREFTAGMENSNFIIAINKDRDARIFKFANLSIQGDLHQVIPVVTKQLKALRNHGL